MQELKAREKQTDRDMLMNKQPVFDYVRPTNLLKTESEWAEIKEYCEFVSEFFNAQRQAVSEQCTANLEEFMSKPSTDGKTIF